MTLGVLKVKGVDLMAIPSHALWCRTRANCLRSLGPKTGQAETDLAHLVLLNAYCGPVVLEHTRPSTVTDGSTQKR